VLSSPLPLSLSLFLPVSFVCLSLSFSLSLSSLSLSSVSLLLSAHLLSPLSIPHPSSFASISPPISRSLSFHHLHLTPLRSRLLIQLLGDLQHISISLSLSLSSLSLSLSRSVSVC